MNEVKEYPPEVKAAARHLTHNADFHVLLRWWADENDMGDFGIFEDEREQLVKSGIFGTIAVFARMTACEIVLARGTTLTVRSTPTDENEATPDDDTETGSE